MVSFAEGRLREPPQLYSLRGEVLSSMQNVEFMICEHQLVLMWAHVGLNMKI